MSNENTLQCKCRAAGSEKAGSDNTTSFNCCVQQRLWWMLRNKCFSDICFIVGSEPKKQQIHAHKSVLSASGAVFNAMFNENWSSKSTEIEVPDVEPDVFFSLLRFVYTDDIQVTADSVMKILYAAKKYAILSLEDRCAEFLKDQMRPEDAWALLTQATVFDQQKLIESCLEIIDENPEDAFLSDGFTSIDLALLRSVLKRDTLRIAEIDVFEAVLRWSKAECERKNLDVSAENQKSVLEDALYLVRFPLMKQQEFATKVLPCGLVSNEACLEMFQYYSGVPIPLSCFISTPRSSKESLTVNRFQPRHYSTWSYGESRNDGIGFSFDHNVRLVGFGLYQLNDDSSEESEDDDSDIEDVKEDAEYKVDLTVKSQETGDVLYHDFSTHKKEYFKNTFKVFLKKPVKLTANTLYAVIAKIQGPDSIYGNQGKTQVSAEDSYGRKVTVTFHSISYEGSDRRTNTDQGQIPEIVFSC